MNPAITLRTSRYSEPALSQTMQAHLHAWKWIIQNLLKVTPTYSVMSQISDNHFHNMTNEAMDNPFRAPH